MLLKTTIAKVHPYYNLTIINLNPVYSLGIDILLTKRCTFFEQQKLV